MLRSNQADTKVTTRTYLWVFIIVDLCQDIWNYVYLKPFLYPYRIKALIKPVSDIIILSENIDWHWQFI